LNLLRAPWTWELSEFEELLAEASLLQHLSVDPSRIVCEDVFPVGSIAMPLLRSLEIAGWDADIGDFFPFFAILSTPAVETLILTSFNFSQLRIMARIIRYYPVLQSLELHYLELDYDIRRSLH
jgi:hypothetical protein